MNKLIVSSSPHIRRKKDTPSIMLDVVIALLPAVIASVVLYGFKALIILATCVLTAVVSEFLFNLITKREQTIFDFSAVVTGLILGLSLHSKVEIWQCVLGAVFAIIVVKCLFGGLGANFANPAATARVFMLICFPAVVGGVISSAPDIIASATPLTEAGSIIDVVIKNPAEVILEGEKLDLPSLREMFLNGFEIVDKVQDPNDSTKVETFVYTLPSLLDMFLGNRGGAIGEGSIVALLIGFIYLVVRRVIKFETPLIMIATVFVLSLINSGNLGLALYQTLGGGVIFAAIFMITDYSTTPITRTGKMIFAFGCGLITFLIRTYAGMPEGVSYAIVIMNILAPAIELLTKPRALGKRGNK